MDVNLYYDMLAGCSVTGILQFCIDTLVDCLYKQQVCEQTSLLESEFSAATFTVDQTFHFCSMFLYLGVPSKSQKVLVRDNQAVVHCSAITHSCRKLLFLTTAFFKQLPQRNLSSLG
jgi:hypothetical protein